MSWSTPRTWVDGETPPASTFNAHIRDNLLALGGDTVAFTPNWTGSGGNPAIGNGTLEGGMWSAGKRIRAWFSIVMGASTTYGAGAWQLDFPVAETPYRWTSADFVARDVSASQSFPMAVERTASGLLTVRAHPIVAGDPYRQVSSTVPFTWAAGDELFGTIEYESP